jgi:UDP-3-O-[3-hydroxymyristoyl] glucosamine N-acyltransferase
MEKKGAVFRMVTLAELSELVAGEVLGDGTVEIEGAAGLDCLREGVITLAATENAVAAVLNSPAAAVIVPESITELAKPAIRVANPRLAFAKILTFFAPPATCVPGIDPTAAVGRNFKGLGCQVGPLVAIGDDVTIEKGTIIHPGAVIGDRVVIGEDSVIHANVVVREECRISNRVLIHAGTVIGADGFGYVTVEGRHYKVPQLGIVVIEDDVEIGANTTIDRATTGITLVKQGTKIDNLVQVAHNCKVGANNLICGQAGMAGSTILGDRVTLAGKAGIVGHLEIGDDSVVAGLTKVTGDLPPHSYVCGDPARPLKKQLRLQASLSHLPDLVKEVRELRKMVMEMQKGEEREAKPGERPR